MRTITSVLGFLILQFSVIQSNAQAVITCEGETVLLSASTDLSDWQWQQNIEGDWINLEEQGDVLGVDSSDLTFVDVNSDLNDLGIRCLSSGVLSGNQDSIVYGPVNLVINSALNPPSISWGSIPQNPSCFDAPIPLIDQTIEATGGSGNYLYQWQSFVDGIWNNLPDLDPSVLSLGQITNDILVRQSVVDVDGNCGPVYSNELSLEVLAPFNSDGFEIELLGDSPICFETSPGSLSASNLPTGGAMNNVYQWELNDQGTWEQIANANSITYEVPDLSTSKSYRLVVTDVCGQATSNEIFVEVFEELDVPEIALTSATTLPLCSVNEGFNLEVIQAPIGGGENFELQWYSRVLGGDWIALAGENNSDYSTLFLEESSEFYLEATSLESCGTVPSNVLSTPVYDPLMLGSLSADQTICFGAESETLNPVGLSGGSGQYDYSWFSSLDGVLFSELFGENQSTLGPQTLFEDEIFRLEVTDSNGCGNVLAEATVEVLPELSLASIDYALGEESICFNTESPLLEITQDATGGNEIFSTSWEYNVTGDWVDVPNSDDISSVLISTEIGPLQENHQVRLVSSSDFGCGDVLSNVVEIEVYGPLEVGQVSDDQLICFETAPADLEVTLTTGGGNDFEYTWYEYVGMAWEPIQGANTLSYNPGILADSVQFRVEAVNLNACGTIVYDEIAVNVLPELPSPQVVGIPLQAICYESDLSLSATNLIDYPFYSYSWLLDDGIGLNVLDGETDLNLSLEQLLDQTYQVQFLLVSDYDCGQVNSSIEQFEVLPDLNPAEINFVDGELQTFCFGLDSPDIEVIDNASGSQNDFSYTWQITTNDQTNDIAYVSSPQDLMIQLTDTIGVSLLAVDNYGCGEVLSNEVLLNVYPELMVDAYLVPDSICYGATPEASFLVYGGNDSFEYEWFSSFDGVDYSPVENELGSSIIESNWTSDFYLYSQATSSAGCGVLTSTENFITVLDELTPGVLSVSVEESCFGEEINYEVTSPSGGYNDFTEVWYYSSSNPDVLEEITNNDLGTLSIIAEGESANVSVVFESVCGVVQTDTISTPVNPLPNVPQLIGDFDPCDNSVDQLYEVGNWQNNVVYEWSISGDGVITSGESMPTVLIDWMDIQDGTSINVLATDIITGCTSLWTEEVMSNGSYSPPQTEVVKKPLINILVSADSTDCATYQWGQIDILTGELEMLPGATEQYIFIEDLNPDVYYYFVDVVYNCGDGELSCPVRNYYQYDPFIGLEEYDHQVLQMYPNPSNGQVNLSYSENIQFIEIFSQTGEILQRIVPSDRISSMLINIDYPSGMYFVRINGKSNKRLVILK